MKRAEIGSPPVKDLIFDSAQSLAVLNLLCGHEPRAPQSGKICRMALVAAYHKGFGWRDRSVVAEDSRHCI